MAKHSRVAEAMTVGIDLGDKFSRLCVLDTTGQIVEESRVRSTQSAFQRRFTAMEASRVALEVGSHSPWIQRLLEGLGHEVVVANARQVRLIYLSDRKDDRLDAERLARLARVDPKLLSPIRHRAEETQLARALLSGRELLVECRTKLINHVRGVVKSAGGRLVRCSAPSFHKRADGQLPASLRPALQEMVSMIGELTRRIRASERQIEEVASTQYPVTELLRQVSGVGVLTALSYVLTIEDPWRFSRSRSVGAYLGLRPRRSQSGSRDPELRISKTGDGPLRRLLVGSAQYILGPFGPDTDLRRWGLALAERGKRNAKKRAVVAVARKLAVLLHRLWVTAETYEPLRNSTQPRPGLASLPIPA
jgi:transposase